MEAFASDDVQQALEDARTAAECFRAGRDALQQALCSGDIAGIVRAAYELVGIGEGALPENIRKFLTDEAPAVDPSER